MQNNGGGRGSSSGGNSFTRNYSYFPGLDNEGWLTVGNGKRRGHMWDLFYTCSHCSKTFFTPQALSGHQNSHRLEREALRREHQQRSNKHAHADAHENTRHPHNRSAQGGGENQTERTDAHSHASVHQSNRGLEEVVLTGATKRPQKRTSPELRLEHGAGNRARQGELHPEPTDDSSQVYQDQMATPFHTQGTKNLLRGMEMEAVEGNQDDSEATVTCPATKKTCWCGCESAEGSDSEESDNEASSKEVDLSLKL
ncbi:hypothetical protein ACLOJK_017474 [Asimina triloba]